MYLLCRSVATLVLVVLATSAWSSTIRVCADANNLPFSNAARAGFENRIIEALAPALGATVQYVWWDDRRATAIDAMQRHLCDVVPGALAGMPHTATTPPYLRSGYAFVTRTSGRPIVSFDDPALKTMSIGVQSIGDEGIAPPAVALLHRGLASNIRAYTFHGHLNDPDSAAGIVGDVASGRIDAAVLWGPFAGYFARRQKVPVSVSLAQPGPTDLQMLYDIAMATRADDTALRDALSGAIETNRAAISAILADYGVPVTDTVLQAVRQ